MPLEMLSDTAQHQSGENVQTASSFSSQHHWQLQKKVSIRLERQPMWCAADTKTQGWANYWGESPPPH